METLKATDTPLPAASGAGLTGSSASSTAGEDDDHTAGAPPAPQSASSALGEARVSTAGPLPAPPPVSSTAGEEKVSNNYLNHRAGLSSSYLNII